MLAELDMDEIDPQRLYFSVHSVLKEWPPMRLDMEILRAQPADSEFRTFNWLWNNVHSRLINHAEEKNLQLALANDSYMPACVADYGPKPKMKPKMEPGVQGSDGPDKEKKVRLKPIMKSGSTKGKDVPKKIKPIMKPVMKAPKKGDDEAKPENK